MKRWGWGCCGGVTVVGAFGGGGTSPGGSGTCVLMGKLAGPVVPAAFRGQPVDEVVLVESIPQSGKNQMTEVPDGLDVGLGVPEGRGRRRDWS